jgi:hypothetical protein
MRTSVHSIAETILCGLFNTDGGCVIFNKYTTKVAHWIESNTKSERQYHTNYGIIEEITHHGSGYSSAICEALGVDPDSHKWIAVEERKA